MNHSNKKEFPVFSRSSSGLLGTARSISDTKAQRTHVQVVHSGKHYTFTILLRLTINKISPCNRPWKPIGL